MLTVYTCMHCARVSSLVTVEIDMLRMYTYVYIIFSVLTVGIYMLCVYIVLSVY